MTPQNTLKSVCNHFLHMQPTADLKAELWYLLLCTVPVVADLGQILHVAVTDSLQRILPEGTGVYQIFIPGAIPWLNTLFYTFYYFLIMRRGDLCSIFPINLG